MNTSRDVTIKAGQCGLVVKALTLIQGKKPASLSYRIGCVSSIALDKHNQFVDELKKFIKEEGDADRTLTKEEVQDIKKAVEADIVISIPHIALEEIISSDQYVLSDDTVLPFLVRVGVLTEGGELG